MQDGRHAVIAQAAANVLPLGTRCMGPYVSAASSRGKFEVVTKALRGNAPGRMGQKVCLGGVCMQVETWGRHHDHILGRGSRPDICQPRISVAFKVFHSGNPIPQLASHPASKRQQPIFSSRYVYCVNHACRPFTFQAPSGWQPSPLEGSRQRPRRPSRRP